MTVGEIIKEQRTKQCLTQLQLANLLGVSEGAVCKWEKKPSFTPSTKHLVKLSRLFGISMDELIGSGLEANRLDEANRS